MVEFIFGFGVGVFLAVGLFNITYEVEWLPPRKTKYRIVSDRLCGYDAQFKPWYFPFFWFQCNGDGFNSRGSIEEARGLIKKHYKNKTFIEEVQP